MRYRLMPALSLAVVCVNVPAKSQPKPGATETTVNYRRAQEVLPQHIERLIPNIVIDPHWIAKGSDFWIRRRTQGGFEYLRVDPRRRSFTPLFDAVLLSRRLSAATGSEVDAADLYDMTLDDEAGSFSFVFGERRWRYQIATTRLVEEKEKTPVGSTISPDGSKRAFVRDHDVWVEDIRSGTTRQMTRGGTPEQPFGTTLIDPDRMMEQGTDKPVLPPAVWWSPDSRKLVTYKIDLRGVRRVTLLQSNPKDGVFPRYYSYYYPYAADEVMPTARTVVIDVDRASSIVSSEEPRTVYYYYGGPTYEWSGDGRSIYSPVAQRGYRRLELRRIDAGTGRSSALVTEADPRYVAHYGQSWWYDARNDLNFWTSERTGTFQLYRVGGDARVRRLTSGASNVIGIEGLSADGKSLLFVATGRERGRDPYLRSLYSVPLTGGRVRALTPEALDHKVSVSPDGAYVVDNMSLVDVPTRTVVRDATTGEIVMRLGEADTSRYLAAGYKLPERFTTLAADGRTKLYGALYKPAGFHATVKYPVIEYSYTGPHTFATPKSFEAGMIAVGGNAMAQLGAIALTVDGRGSFGRSHAFQAHSYGKLYAVGMDDHVAAIRHLAAKHAWIDDARVGIYGYSAGGYDVLRAMTGYPGFYKVGVAASGNYDNQFDKALWNEQWLGSDIAHGYAENATTTKVSSLTGKLMLGLGAVDSNVPIASTYRLVDALTQANKDYELVLVPQGGHILERNAYFVRRRWDFFVRNLLGRTPPDAFRMEEFPHQKGFREF